MQIINTYTHPIHGRCYLWGSTNMFYQLGTVSSNYMTFEGYTLDEVVELIKDKGFHLEQKNPDS